MKTIRSKWNMIARLLRSCLMLAALAGLAEPQRPVQAQGEVEVILLLPHGFEPAEISRPPGPFLLVIKSYDHERDHAFDAAAADQGVLPATILREQERWTGLVDLKAGDHALQDHDRGDRRLKITIRP